MSRVLSALTAEGARRDPEPSVCPIETGNLLGDNRAAVNPLDYTAHAANAVGAVLPSSYRVARITLAR